ncbi:MAG: hypothetical protein P8M22_08470 [Phycisphaerales bacterium]|nr:hypothetical protein [Phycisphaerales bacterium]
MRGLIISWLVVLLGVLGLMSPAAMAADDIECDPVEIAKLLASDGAEGDYFGCSVAISGTTALIGADGDDDNGYNSGSAYILEQQDDGTWLETAKLTALDGASNDWFGLSVAISETTALVGAYEDDDNGSDSGSAYIFERQPDGSWLEIPKLTASDGAEGDYFGFSVAISGTTALVGAVWDDDNGNNSGSAYIFEQQPDGSWLETAKLLASDGAAVDFFGEFVAISGTTALVGARLDDENGDSSGSAYIFEQQEDGTWLETTKLLASDGAESDNFGYPVTLSGTTALVGAYGNDDNGSSSGSAYIFEQQDDGTWLETAKLLASDGAGGDWFGISVAISGTTALVGAFWDDDNGEKSGSAYIFEQQEDGFWLETAKLIASDGASDDQFGDSVATSGTTAMIGAYRDDDNGTDSGSAYMFAVVNGIDAVDCNGNAICDELDLAARYSLDCDGNGVPDECDIADGLYADVDLDGIPDACEEDCDGDLVPDDYEIEQGTELDCNGNTIPDSCDIANGTSPDGDGDGIPDECDPSYVITVATDGTGLLNQIQPAIDLALPGATIQVASGTYDGSLVFPDHAIQLISVDGPESTIITGDDYKAVIRIGQGHAADTLLEGFTLTGGDAYLGGGLQVIQSAPTIRNCIFLANQTGGAWINQGAPIMEDCQFLGNLALRGGGIRIEGIHSSGDPVQLNNCLLEANNANGTDAFNGSGGGMAAKDAAISLIRTDFLENTSSFTGGGLIGNDSNLNIEACNFLNNVASSPGGGLTNLGGDLSIADSGFCANTPDDILGSWDDLGGNLFGKDCDNDGTCDFTQISENPDLDCDGDSVLDSCEIADGIEPDCNENGIPDWCDINVYGTSNDFNQNGVPDDCKPDCNDNGLPDYLDIQLGNSEDCDGNGIPDECEDCNENGIGDACDITDGTSTDLNGNGVPDECDIDCDGDGLPDDYEIEEGLEEDCNANGIPDWCDLDDGTSEDCNGNGIPDTCDEQSGVLEDCDANGLYDQCEAGYLDCNGNNHDDFCDIESGASEDCNGNGIPDECDATSGVLNDCNANGLYDECEEGYADCQPNGIADFCDITDGTSNDFNLNGLPDECEPDCNDNSVPDFIDIAFGTSEDTNNNGIPDECECPDTNGDGLVDVNDILAVIDAWGDCVPDQDCPADVDGDDVVDVNDLLLVIGEWGTCE